ncbi:Erythromycin esterase [Streptomyces reticuli]|nr:Erythromycin esterase [Streptomyces reticuli]
MENGERMTNGEVRRWLAEHAWPLKEPDGGYGGPAEPGDADLAPLREVLRDVRVLGMGEATHGTAEFFRLKHRLLRFLVRDLGCTTLALEASASAARAVDDHVRHGTGDAAAALAGLGFWTWRTREMLDVVEWLRAHNRTVPPEHAVRFVGIDPQRCGPSLAAVEAVLRAAAPERAPLADGPLAALADAPAGSLAACGPELLAAADDLTAFLEQERPRLADRAGAEAADRALGHARLIAAAADVAARPPHGTGAEPGALAARDRHMARAVLAAAERAAGPVAVWAHNGHVASEPYGGGVPAMGQHLRARLGARYYALGLLFGAGAFRARPGTAGRRPPRRHTVGAAGPRSLEGQLAAATPGDHLIDLRAGRADPAVARWLDTRHFVRAFGAGVPRVTYRMQLAAAVPGRAYDGLAYVARSTPSVPLD